jgi:hypothetical protein
MLRGRGVSVWVDLFVRGEQGAAAVGVVTVAGDGDDGVVHFWIFSSVR